MNKNKLFIIIISVLVITIISVVILFVEDNTPFDKLEITDIKSAFICDGFSYAITNEQELTSSQTNELLSHIKTLSFKKKATFKNFNSDIAGIDEQFRIEKTNGEIIRIGTYSTDSTLYLVIDFVKYELSEKNFQNCKDFVEYYKSQREFIFYNK